MASFIGIKLANGDFYPILTEKAARQRKRLVLTTVTDGQNSVQIDLHRNETKTMKNASYVGTLVVENISPKKKGEPSIEMIIDSSADGDITVSAIDLDNKAHGERQQLNVSLRSFNESAEVYSNIDDTLGTEDSGTAAGVNPRGDEAASRRNLPLLIVLILMLLAVCAFAMWFFMFGGKAALSLNSAPHETAAAAPSPPTPAKTPPPPQPKTLEHDAVAHDEPSAPETPPPPPPAESAPPPVVIQAPPEPPPAPPQASEKNPPASRRRLVPPVSQFNVPSPIPPDGVWYTIRWGDTLWAISEAFYRNPWDYRFLARYNGIHNPSYIISGRQVKIPPR